jgi:hypothetical protein
VVLDQLLRRVDGIPGPFWCGTGTRPNLGGRVLHSKKIRHRRHMREHHRRKHSPYLSGAEFVLRYQFRVQYATRTWIRPIIFSPVRHTPFLFRQPNAMEACLGSKLIFSTSLYHAPFVRYQPGLWPIIRKKIKSRVAL